jgi:hypothetical protein
VRRNYDGAGGAEVLEAAVMSGRMSPLSVLSATAAAKGITKGICVLRTDFYTLGADCERVFIAKRAISSCNISTAP